jgi:hypothetical protein
VIDDGTMVSYLQKVLGRPHRFKAFWEMGTEIEQAFPSPLENACRADHMAVRFIGDMEHKGRVWLAW